MSPRFSVQFFDRAGAAALKVFWNFGEPIAPELLGRFRQLRDTFRAIPREAGGSSQPSREYHQGGE